MSCHDIGRGLNEVTRLVIDMYDKQEIGLSQAKRLIATCGIAVYWCDGHEAEAKDCIIRCRCGKCLRSIPENEHIYYLEDGLKYLNWEGVIDIIERESLVTSGLCKDCFEKIASQISEEAKSEIETCSIPSEGAIAGHNNGCRWVRDTDWFS